ncbi:hypothetical protein Q8F55_006743 [Vanrija albida]|uniref:Sulfatase-modifying factor enzyme domain-containing protein n=1 Tax=Vanrija albida TaxID=181172 RepID=A0ABR3PY04_9TREE
MAGTQIYTLPDVAVGSDSVVEPLRDQIERGLAGTAEPTIPGNTEGDKAWSYKRSVPTVVLYDADGLRLYDRITADAPEYYLFADELNLLKSHGHEIVRAMGFPGHGYEQPEEQDGGDKVLEELFFPPIKGWRPARWGDVDVGRFNGGVNGEEGLGGGWDRGWDVVELGAGALHKTAHLLTALAEALPPAPKGIDTPAPITYHALDLSWPELARVLKQMDKRYGNTLSGRVATVGLHGDYTAGLKLVREGGLASLATSGRVSPDQSSSPSTAELSSSPNSVHSDNLITPAMMATRDDACFAPEDDIPVLATSMGSKWTHPPAARPTPPAAATPRAEPSEASPHAEDRPVHFLFLGSSLGNFDRESAAPFLRSLPLRQGDTLLLGLDGRPAPGAEGRRKVEVAYNDPQGHTRAFEEHGWDVAMEELGLAKDDHKVEFVGRYNEVLGRHEAYFRSKEEQTLHLPGLERDVTLDKDELLHIEWSYKYSLAEALGLFEAADLRVVDSWKAPDSEYRLWLLERPDVRFTENPVQADEADDKQIVSMPKGVASWDEWEAMWKLWDHITLDMIPQEMLHQKPIDLRHICLFYLGHIPTFLDIYLSRITDGTHSEPVFFKDIFERGIDPDVDDPTKIHSHSEVPKCEEDWPVLDEILGFRDRVRARLRKIYDEVEAGKALTRHEARSIFMGFEHEAMHAETLLYMLLQSPLTRPPTAVPQWDVLKAHWAAERSAATAKGAKLILEVPETTVTLGHDDLEADDTASSWKEHEFGWDNEHPEHRVAVQAFRVDALPISNGQYRRFLDVTGKLPYLVGATAPASWVQVNGEWHVRSLYGPVPFSIAGSWPLMASRDEFVAYAASVGGRLPTEAELRALWSHPEGPRPTGPTANVGFKNWHPVAPQLTARDNAGTVIHGHNGGVWEWTATRMEPFDGYVASKLYPGYSSDFFDDKHYVVLGGSFATVPQIAGRASFRNWYQGNYRYAWCGARVVYNA